MSRIPAQAPGGAVSGPGGQPSRLTVLAGPSGVGKGTVSADVRRRYPQVWISVSTTTRPPRLGEIDGVHYHFVSEATFDAMVEQGEFLEWAVVHGRYRYGTPRAAVEAKLAQGAATLLEIEVQGATQVRLAMPEARFVFLAPPSWEELVNRLEGRGTETAEQRERRLQTARDELALESQFDVVVVNDEVRHATDELVRCMGIVPEPVGYAGTTSPMH